MVDGEQTFDFDAPRSTGLWSAVSNLRTARPNTRFEFQGRQALHTRIEPQSDGILVVFEGTGNGPFVTSEPVEGPPGEKAAEEWAADAVAETFMDEAAENHTPATILSTINIQGSMRTRS